MPLKETTTGTSSNPLQRIIESLDTYIKDPASATKKTFVAIKKELVDIKGFMDDEGSEDEDENTSHNSDHGSSNTGNPGLVITIGRAKEGKR